MSTEIRHLSPAETAVRLGVSVKALRVYERRGLVTPLRTTAGWRAYGPGEIARLHQVLALKGLGLPLARIAELLAGQSVELDGLLAAQEQALAAHRHRLDRALVLLRTARAKLKAGEALSIDDLTTLAKETTMSDQEMKSAFKPFIDKHFTEADRPALAAAHAGGYDQEQITAEWNALFAECRVLAEKGDPTTPEAMDLAGRWMAQVRKFTGGDPSLFQKSGAVWKDAMSDPETASRLPATPEMFAFIGKAEAARMAASPLLDSAPIHGEDKA